ncbi:MAG TPA: enoyl-CoA hydratase-related protein [Ktedonobacterales bacterium]|nr:enoyl-CoA hydratase-related protein [Ktedonobacterales bacterium]
MDYETLAITVDSSVATITLNRPEARNALSHQMVEDLLDFFQSIRNSRDVRVVVMRAAGKTFCVGGDIRDLSAPRTEAEERAAIAKVDTLLRAVNRAPQVVIQRIHGAVLGGGIGLVSVSDIALASAGTRFGLPEVRLGIVPSLISPFVVQRLGLTNARRWMLTGVQYDAGAAQAIGLIHEVCDSEETLDQRVDATVHEVLQCSPNALAECKKLLFEVLENPDTLAYRVDLLNRLRRSDDGQEGMRAFLEKRPARWVPQ